MKTSASLGNLRRTARAGRSTAQMAAIPADPPAAAGDSDWAYIGDWRAANSAAPRALKASVRNDAASTINDGFWVGWNATDSVAEHFADLRDGKTVTLAIAPERGFGQLLEHVPACYTHVTLVGTVSAGNTTVIVEPVEEQ